METQTVQIGKLPVGTIINYTNCVTADDTNYLIVSHYSDSWGNFTKVVNLETLEEDHFTQHTLMQNMWSVVSPITFN